MAAPVVAPVGARLGQTVLSIFDVARQFTCQEMPWEVSEMIKNIDQRKRTVYMAWLWHGDVHLQPVIPRFNRYPA